MIAGNATICILNRAHMLHTTLMTLIQQCTYGYNISLKSIFNRGINNTI